MTDVYAIQGDNLKTGDTEPVLEVKLRKDNGNPKDLSGATVSFFMQEVDETSLNVDDDTNGNVVIEDAAQGHISYTWQSGDTETAGTYECEFEVDDGNVSTYPNIGYTEVRVHEGLN